MVPNYKRIMGKGKEIMVEDVVGGNKKKPVLPRPTSIIVRDRKVFSSGPDHMLAHINEEKWALFFCLRNKSLEQDRVVVGWSRKAMITALL
ncbi:hypothetical protein Tco_0648924 [Tanacetum coccineum]